MQPVQWCNLCQAAPATGVLRGHFADLPDEGLELMACTECAEKSLKGRGDVNV